MFWGLSLLFCLYLKHVTVHNWLTHLSHSWLALILIFLEDFYVLHSIRCISVLMKMYLKLFDYLHVSSSG